MKTTPAPMILVAELYTETNTFIHQPSGIEAFSVKRGEEILKSKGDVSNLGGFLEAAAGYGWEIYPTIAINGFPGGTVTNGVMETFKKEFLQHFPAHATQKISAVVLLCHGAMVSESMLDVEGEMLAWIRQHPQLQEVPIFGTLDPHGNYTQKMADFSTCFTAYRMNPHTDSREASFRLAKIMASYFENQTKLQTFYRHAQVIWPPTGTASASDPILTLQKMARSYEEKYPEIMGINVFSGFSFSDTPDAGVSFSVTTSAFGVPVDEILKALSEKAWEMRDLGFPQEWTPAEALEKISKQSGLSLMVEPSDNIGGGTLGDGVEVLRAILKTRIRPAAVILQAPAAVAQLQGLALGEEKCVKLGRLYEGPSSQLELKVKVLRHSDGRFTLSDPHSHAAASGAEKEMGETVIAEHDGVTLMLTSRPTPPWDLAQWKSQGIDPRTFKVIGIKGAVAHRQAYDPIAQASYFVDTEGPARSNLKKVTYKNLRRPIYPLDDISK